jgi:single-strand DNA-binding protein
MNVVILSGFISKEPELTYTKNNNTAVTRFSLAVKRRIKGDVDTDFINIVAWGKSAEFVAKYFKKGDGIIINGNMQTRSYDKDGHKVYVTEVIAENIDFPPVRKSDKADAFDRVDTFAKADSILESRDDEDDDDGSGLPF